MQAENTAYILRHGIMYRKYGPVLLRKLDDCPSWLHSVILECSTSNGKLGGKGRATTAVELEML
jgi:hypothetical protein